MPQAQDGVRPSFENYSSELDAMYGDDVDLDISPTSRNIRGRNAGNDQDGAEGSQRRNKRLQRLTFEQAHMLEGYESYRRYHDWFQVDSSFFFTSTNLYHQDFSF